MLWKGAFVVSCLSFVLVAVVVVGKRFKKNQEQQSIYTSGVHVVFFFIIYDAKRSWKWRTGTKHEGDERGMMNSGRAVYCCLFCCCRRRLYRAVVVAHFSCAQFIFSRKLMKTSIGWSQQTHHKTTTNNAKKWTIEVVSKSRDEKQESSASTRLVIVI